MMSFEDYQDFAMTTAPDDDSGLQVLVYTTKLAGEVGEVCELLGKHIGHGRPLNVSDLELELGDVLWYVTALASVYGLSLADIAQENLNKLSKRYPDGFKRVGE